MGSSTRSRPQRADPGGEQPVERGGARTLQRLRDQRVPPTGPILMTASASSSSLGSRRAGPVVGQFDSGRDHFPVSPFRDNHPDLVRPSSRSIWALNGMGITRRPPFGRPGCMAWLGGASLLNGRTLATGRWILRDAQRIEPIPGLVPAIELASCIVLLRSLSVQPIKVRRDVLWDASELDT